MLVLVLEYEIASQKTMLRKTVFINLQRKTLLAYPTPNCLAAAVINPAVADKTMEATSFLGQTTEWQKEQRFNHRSQSEHANFIEEPTS